MTMSFKTTSKVYTAKVAETPIPTTLPPTTTSKTSKTPAKSDRRKDNIIIALSVMVAILLIAMATMAICFIRRMAKTTQAQDNGNRSNAQPKETHYMDLQGQIATTDSTYAGLQSQYEEIHDAARNYENTKHLSSIL
ncbi:uncharacterized protein LOC135684984 [Rhopilema esculentum]|uniref:uncharacterized protein LOC135684984 n=1 Tax=Rhopilema esculentum TaxID=499914 RepID=UPI0031D9FEE0